MKNTWTYKGTRFRSHVVLAILSLIACGLAALYASTATISEIIAIGTGYSALLLIAATLLIGPLNLLRKRRNPVNIDLRRDVGIWAGINTCVHVFFSFGVFEGGQILRYFLAQNNGPRTDIFGLSNAIGLIAFLVLLPILITSNQIALRLLKGKRWKTLQRLTYGVAALGLIHTIGFQFYNVREPAFTYGVVALCLAVVVAQSIGIAVTMSRTRQRRASNASPVSVPVLQPIRGSSPVMARRRFLALTGMGLVGGAAFGAGLAEVMRSTTATATANTGAVADQSSVATTAPTATAPADTATSVPTASAQSGNQDATSVPATTTASAPATSAQSGNQGATSAPTATPKVTPRNVLTTVAALPAGQALEFTTPDTGESAFVVHRADGSVTCFSGICTHEPVNLTFDELSQTLLCPRHDVPFSTQDGSPAHGPARSALTKFSVKVDSTGNIIYGSA